MRSWIGQLHYTRTVALSEDQMPDSGRTLSAYFKSGDFWNHKNFMSLCRLKVRHSEVMTHALPLSNKKLGPLPLPLYFGCLQGEISITTLCNSAPSWKLEMALIHELKSNKRHRCSFQYNQRLLTNCVIVALHSNSLDEHDIFDSREYQEMTLKLYVQLPWLQFNKIVSFFISWNQTRQNLIS